MDEIAPGSVGSLPSLSLRLGQAVFSTAALLFMSVGVEFYSYTSFCFLVTSMGLLIPWSCFLAVVDVYSLFLGCPLRLPGAIILIVVGDWVLSLLSLGAACATASVVTLLLSANGYCPPGVCGRYQLSAAMAFLSWFLTASSSLFNLWSLASLHLLLRRQYQNMIAWNRHVPSAGSTGTTGGLVLRFAQLALSLASFLLIISRTDFYHYTSFRFMWIAMCFIITWCTMLVAWESSFNCFFRQPLFQMEVLMIVILDWVFSLLSLAAGCASASVVDKLLGVKELCRYNFCFYCQISAALAILNWFLIVVSALLNIRSLK